MERIVIKRDGRAVPFERERIATAIFKAARAVGGRDRATAERLAGMVEWMVENKFYKHGRIPSVEDIQDIVEKVLIEEGHAKVAKAYILYRQKRAEARELESIFVDGIKLVDEYIERSDWRVAENSNMTYSLQGLNFYLASSVVARYWLNKIYPPEIKEAHDSGDFHIHDLGILGVYCVGWDLEDLLRVGFGGVRGKIESKPAKHFRVALGQIVNFFYTLQGEAAGAQAFSIHPKETVIIRDKNGIKIVKIGEFVDSLLAEKSQVKPNGVEYRNTSDLDFEVLSFTDDGRTVWKKLKAAIRHKVTDPLRKVRTNRGILHVSNGHSVFSLEKHIYLGPKEFAVWKELVSAGELSGKEFTKIARQNGVRAPKKLLRSFKDKGLVEVVQARKQPDGSYILIRLKFTNRLLLKRTVEIGDGAKETKQSFVPNVAVVTSVKLPERTSIDLFELIAGLSDEVKKSIRVSVVEEQLEAFKAHIHARTSYRALSLAIGMSPSYVHSAVTRNSIPFSLYESLRFDDTERFKVHVSEAVPRKFEGERLSNLVKLIAWYLTEGSTKGKLAGIVISQKDPSGVKRIRAILDRLNAIYREVKRENGKIEFHVGGVYGKILPELCGHGASEKRIPSFIFELAPNLKLEFVHELIRGDGTWRSDGFATYTTTSNYIATGLNLILASLGISSSVKIRNERHFKGVRSRGGRRTRYDIVIDFSGQNRGALPFGDLSSAVVLENEPMESDVEYEYDLSVEDTERFVGGVGLFALHNSNFDTLLAPFIRYDNLSYRDVKQAIQEFLFNVNVPTRVGFQSLAYDMPVIVRKNGKIRIEKIGKLIEFEFNRNRRRVIPNLDGYGNISKDSFAVPPSEGYEALGFDEHGRIKWLKIKAFVKHRVPDRRFKKIRTGAGEARVSPAHSLFHLNDNEIKPISASELTTARPNGKLSTTNHILTVNSVDFKDIFGSQEKLDLVDLIDELPPTVRKNIFVKLLENDAVRLKEKLQKFYGSVKQMVYEYGRTDKSAIYELLRKNTVPFDVWRELGDDNENARFYIKPYEDRQYERFLSGEKLEAFVKFAAWFVSEGKVSGSSVEIVQDSAKSHEIEDVLKVLDAHYSLKSQHGYSSKNRKPTDTELNLYRISGLYAYILPYVAGATSSEKRVPFFVFDLTPKLKKLFIETLFKGNGHDEGYRISYTSLSETLLAGVSLLAASLGWRVRLTRKDRRTNVHTLLIYPSPKKELEFVKGDLAGVPVYEVSDYEYDHEWEYDISVEAPTENFVGGAGLMVFHNTPFTNITLDLTVSPLYKGKHVIIGGKEMPETYDEFQEEMDMLNRAFAEVMMEGDAKSRIFTFPIPTYNITRDFDWNNDKLKPIWEMTAKFGVPYFANFVHSDMKPEDARSMCCRLRLDNRELRKRGGGLFGAAPLTGSIGVVTINLPRIGYLAKNEDEFFQMLEDRMFLAHKSLEIKRKVLEDLTERGLYPYSKFYLRSIKEAVGRYWNNHFSTIGLVGMNEMTRNFLGVPIIHPEAREFALKVLKFMREKIADFQAETGNLYNLEATPAEGASYRLAKKDLEHYPGIKTAGTVTSPYYTNSVHVPVDYTNDIFEILEHQDELQIQFTGGTVVHLFIGEAIHDWHIVRDLVRQIVSNYRLPYFSLTPTFSVCPIHGYIPGEHWICPYPHSEEDLKKFGRVMELDIEELQQLQEGAYIIVDEDEEDNDEPEAPFGGLILKLDNL